MAAILSFALAGGDDDAMVKDIDGNVYKAVKIGSRVWLAENLKVSRYRNGDKIANAAASESWKIAKEGAWCYYDNDSSRAVIFGKLYNWYALNDSRGLCPAGWRVPANDDWQALINHFGGMRNAGGKMKAQRLWAPPNEGADDAAGFAALPSGVRYYTGNFMNIHHFCGMWSSSEGNDDFGYMVYLDKGNTKAVLQFYGKKNGFACRCVKD